MKVNGSLVFDASSASEIQNLRLQKVSSLPAIVSSDVGRLIYNTATNIIHVGVNAGGGGLTWLPLATGGDASALLAEVDSIETSLGLSSNGTFDATAFTGNLGNKTSYVELITTLQSLVATAQAAAVAEVTRATAAEGVLTTNLADEVTRATAAEGVLTTAVDAEVTRATAAEGVLTTAVGAEVTRATNAEGVLTTGLANEITRATTAESTISGAVTTETADRIAADGVLQTAITAEATTARAAEVANATAIAAEVTRATAADSSHTADIAAEIAARIAADTAQATSLAAEVSRATSAEAAITADVDARLQGLSWKNPVRAATTGNISLVSAATGYDGVTLFANDRVLVKSQTNPAENGIYVFQAATSALIRAADMNTAAEFFSATVYVREGSTQSDLGFTQTSEVTTVGSDAVSFVQFAGAGSVTAGDGMTQAGNVLNVVAGDSSITVTADAIEVSAALQTAIADNTTAISAEATRAIAAELVNANAIVASTSAASAALAQEITDRIADVNVEEARAIAAEGVLTTNLADEVTRATAAEGTISGNLATEITNRISGDTANANAITAEATRAGLAEVANTTAITAEATTARAAESALATRVTVNEDKLAKLYFLYDGASATSHTVTHNLGQRYCNVTVIADDEMVIPQSVAFTGINALTVTFNTAIACKVVVMGLA